MQPCKGMKGYIHSIQSMGTVDGPGVRAVVFAEGCPLRCVYCQNPDTWERKEQDAIEADTLAQKLLRFSPYLKNGGVTFSGGEPCMQAAFFAEVARLLKQKDMHIALDTSGAVDTADVDALLDLTDLVLLDIKMTTEEDQRNYIGNSLKQNIAFLDKLERLGKDVWIRHVVVPGINDTEEDILRLRKILKGYSCIRKIELLPYRNICLEKYKSLGIPFALADVPNMSREALKALETLL